MTLQEKGSIAVIDAQETGIAVRQPSAMELIQDALRNNVAPEVLRELVSLQQSMVRFEWEAQERQAKIDFDHALNECQGKVGRIAPNQKRENGIEWADYKQLDRILRPIYIEAGFSIGFSEVDAENNRLRMKATVSRGGVSRDYFADISRTPPNGKMNQLDADAGAASRVKRYLMLDIFNIAIGIDKDEKRGVPGAVMADARRKELLDHIGLSDSKVELQRVYLAALAEAEKVADAEAIRLIIAAKDKRLKELA